MATEPSCSAPAPSQNETEEHPHFSSFVSTIAALRAPDGCPWDRAQTHQSIAHNMIEEAYEAVDAIESNDITHLREELGDVLLQVVLQSQIAADAGLFTIDDVCADINAKMIRRHPHVFGEAQANNASEVLDLWDQVKLAERNTAESSSNASVAGGNDAEPHGLLEGVPSSFPALMQAQKISRKAAAVGFEWNSLDEVWDKVREEVAELQEAYAAAPKAANGKVDAGAASEEGAAQPEAAEQAVANVEQEMGDVLFTLVNVARRMGIDAENALRVACSKFRRRWAFMEGAAWAQGTTVGDLQPSEREELWQLAKGLERPQKSC